jgi:Fe2+ or Zn2+ uptake regulation protein
VKREVEVCDNCNNNLARVKCGMCGNLICLECGIILHFRESQSSDYLIFLERKFLTKNWLSNESIKNFIVCNKCGKETRNAMDNFAKLPREKQMILEGELIKIMKEEMEALLLANKI